ncbi:hypothetical protein PsorP6_012620 [Peronosclerospora sorghi]|uniref:Uncharacterized protein n=1 Tax=Peronosclerospora sorghi TaxID=230839 RepID=A0ACC0WGX3_9STRA|nr:hypothetical protein PsorP6_012620 [Peronosclerospora sorghi]
MYDRNNDASESDDAERPTKHFGLDGDTALMAHIAMIARDLTQSYEEAVNGLQIQHWSIAIDNEFEAHERNKTWTPVKRRPGMQTVGGKCVWAKTSDGRDKARFVALGFLQIFVWNFSNRMRQ